ncbi:unnamed protein product [Mytilus edulis]|uniref:C-type lectin domain-containing protein n=1 Tax=Mytilus edulis TaxID=6550 RepID=A0A8S3Q2I4_MYTED|nr:unnamed protein product [Mytilus edulis]
MVGYHGDVHVLQKTVGVENWSNAELRCRALGGYLAEIYDAETNSFLKTHLKALHFGNHTVSYWIGLTDVAKLNTWEWVHGRSLPNFTDWHPTQPVDNDEHCALLLVLIGNQPDKSCHHGWLPWRRTCFMLSVGVENWSNAELRCRALGGYLAEIHDAETNSFLRNHLKALHFSNHTVSYWIGLTEAARLGTWEWSHSRSLP